MDEAVRVRHAAAQQRYELVDAGSQIGAAEYTHAAGSDADERIFYHTVVDDAYSGQGLAGVLVERALDETIAAGLKIVPVCPYVDTWIRRHPDYQRYVVPAQPEHTDAVKLARES